jgi:hypothetical protein
MGQPVSERRGLAAAEKAAEDKEGKGLGAHDAGIS